MTRPATPNRRPVADFAASVLFMTLGGVLALAVTLIYPRGCAPQSWGTVVTWWLSLPWHGQALSALSVLLTAVGLVFLLRLGFARLRWS